MREIEEGLKQVELHISSMILRLQENASYQEIKDLQEWYKMFEGFSRKVRTMAKKYDLL